MVQVEERTGQADEAAEERLWGVALPVKELFKSNRRCFLLTDRRFIVVTWEADSVAGNGTTGMQARLVEDGKSPGMRDVLQGLTIEREIPWTDVDGAVFGGFRDGTLTMATGTTTPKFRLDSGSWPIVAALMPRIVATVDQVNPRRVFRITEREVVTWGKYNVAIGVISLIANNTLDPVWGFAIAALGIASILGRRPEYLLVTAVAVAWAGLLNAVGCLHGAGGWALFAVFQFAISIGTLNQYRSFRALLPATGLPYPYPPADGFAVTSLLLGLLVPVGLGTAAVAGVVLASTGHAQSDFVLGTILLAAGHIGALAVGFGVGGLYGHARDRWMCFVAIAVGILTLLGLLGFVALAAWCSIP